jgi:hypothetical protein
MTFSVRLPGLSHFPPLTHDWERWIPRISSAEAIVGAIGRLQDLGVTWGSAAPPSTSLGGFVDGLNWVADDVMPAGR